SRTRRAISWPYCEPKSKINTRSFSGSGVILARGCLACGFWIRPEGKQFLQDRFAVNPAVAPIAFDLDLAVLKEVDLPVLPRRKSDNHDRVVTGMSHPVRDLCLVQALEEGQQFAKRVASHLSNLFSFSSLWKVLKPGSRRRCRSSISSHVRCRISSQPGDPS